MGSLSVIWVLFKAILKYGPLIEALIEAMEKGRTVQQAQESATNFERGFRVLTETNNPQLLHDAIMSHCSPEHGCMLDPE